MYARKLRLGGARLDVDVKANGRHMNAILPGCLMQTLLTRLDQQFDQLIADEGNTDGCFTRAYIRAAFSEGAVERKIWGALLSLMASKDQVGRAWDNWLSERLKRHSKTDSRIELRVVRLAADGVWFERIMNARSKNLKGIEEYLIGMTRDRDRR
jgi:hypothetical protein